MKMHKMSILAIGLLLTGFLHLDAQVITRKAITLELAKKVAAAAEAEARKNNLTVFVAIVDDGANLMYLERMDNAQIGSLEVAIQKAHTAISFKRPSKAYEDAVIGGRMAMLRVPGVTPLEGGLPIVVDGQYIGAIGVSGGTAQQDGQIAKAGLEVLNQ